MVLHPKRTCVSVFARQVLIKALLALSLVLVGTIAPHLANAQVPKGVGVLPASAVSAGGIHTCELLPTGNVYCWGGNGVTDDFPFQGGFGQWLPAAVTATAVSTGVADTCVLTSTANVYCWGYQPPEDFAFLELIETVASLLTQTFVVHEPKAYLGGNATAVSAGWLHTCVLLSTGNVECFGRGYGRPTLAYAGGDAAAVSAGAEHTCVLTSMGNVTCWGLNSSGQAASYTGGSAIAVSAGGGHTCALLSTGNVQCWGLNDHGQAAAYPGGDAVAVAAGGLHTCVLLGTGNVHCWGDNNAGEAADYAGGDAVAISAHIYHTCALLRDGSVTCWGDNSFGQSESQHPALAFPAACNDGLDNDLDGRTDYPADPGCQTALDNDESEPLTAPPACKDGVDNDLDGQVDYPADPGCESEADDSEADPDAGVITLSVTTPAVPSGVVTPAVQVPKTCSPGDVVCIGPFTIPPQPLTPTVPSQTIGVPLIEPVPVTPPATISVTATGLDYVITPHVGEFQIVEPIYVSVPTPFGPFPVSLCEGTCVLPVIPEASIDGSLTATISFGSTTVSQTIPLHYP